MDSSELSNFIRNKMREHNLSTYDVAKNSGGIIEQSYVTKLLKGKIANPSTPKLRGLAKGTFTPEEVIFNIAKYPDSTTTILTGANLVKIQELISDLNDEQKDYANKLLKMIIREISELKNFSSN